MTQRRSDRCRQRLATICQSLPEATTRPGGEHGRHVAYVIRSKTFAYLTDDHHGDGRLALTVKAPPGDQQALVGSDPRRFFVPPYLGQRGWVGLWLDDERLDWPEITELFSDAYRLTAPKQLVALLD